MWVSSVQTADVGPSLVRLSSATIFTIGHGTVIISE